MMMFWEYSESLDVRAYFLAAVVATLLLLAGILLMGGGRWSVGLRGMRRVAVLVAAVALGGWTGLAALLTWDVPPMTTARLAVAAALATPLLVTVPSRMLAWRGRSAGGVQRCVGWLGYVYRAIPAGGVGQVRLTDPARPADVVTVDAEAADGGIPAFQNIRVVAARPTGRVLVARQSETHPAEAGATA